MDKDGKVGISRLSARDVNEDESRNLNFMRRVGVHRECLEKTEWRVPLDTTGNRHP